jgi:thiol-disulfide isomerase/thioredoxin
MNDEKKKGKGINLYALVFGALAVIIILAALSTTIFNKGPTFVNTTNAVNLSNYGPTHQITGISAWINSPPLRLPELRGNVVLIDFWTYSCINCIRSIPHLNAWESEYGSNGLVIIGIHTPEFWFEHNLTNVQNAVKRFNITYPVALDNGYGTWDAYGNNAWPAEYLIDKNGDLRYMSYGEGDYNQTELAIRALLQQAGYPVPSTTTNVPLGVNFSGIRSPEIYLGYATTRQALGGGEQFEPNKTIGYYPFNITNINQAYLWAVWYDAPDSVVAVNQSRIYLIYNASKVNVVASGNGNQTTISVKLDGKPLNLSYLGSDDVLVNGNAIATIGPSRLYNIVSAPSYGAHVLEIDANLGFRIYTFTFG